MHEKDHRQNITDYKQITNHEPQTTANTCYNACSINLLSKWPREPGKHQDKGQLWHTNVHGGVFISLSTCFENQFLFKVKVCFENHFQEITFSRCFVSLVSIIVVHVAVEGFLE